MSDSAAKHRTTTHVGPLGSTIHVIRADADTVAELGAVDWNRRFRRVCLDPARGLITLMSPSHPHEDLSTIFDDIVNVAGSILTRAAKNLGNLRLRGQGDPPGTGMEPDCAFYVGERARAYFKARREGQTAVETYVERVAPDLVVEVEITHADGGKAERYRDIGVRELWRLHGRKGTTDLEVEFFALDSERPPRRLDTSVVLEGLTPDAVREAVDGVRFAETDDERREAVARIVHRRQRMSLRVREEREPYPA